MMMQFFTKRFCTLALFGICVSSLAQHSRVIQGEVKFPNESSAGFGIYVVLESDAADVASTLTDAEGRFSFNALAAARYRVHVRADGYREATQEIDLSTNPFGVLRFVLQAKPANNVEQVSMGIVNVPPKEMPSRAMKEYLHGLDDFQAGKFEKSIAHFKKSTDLYASYAPAFYYLGGAHASLGHFEEAGEALKKSVVLNEKFAESYNALGACLFEQKQYEQSEATLRKAVELAPRSFDAHFHLARTLLVLRKVAEAAHHAEQALKADANSAHAHILLGNALLQLKHLEEAVAHYREAVRLSPNGPFAESTQTLISSLESTLKEGPPVVQAYTPTQ